MQLQWPKWGEYYETKGKAGETPDMPAAEELLELYHDWRSATLARRARARSGTRC